MGPPPNMADSPYSSPSSFAPSEFSPRIAAGHTPLPLIPGQHPNPLGSSPLGSFPPMRVDDHIQIQIEDHIPDFRSTHARQSIPTTRDADASMTLGSDSLRRPEQFPRPLGPGRRNLLQDVQENAWDLPGIVSISYSPFTPTIC